MKGTSDARQLCLLQLFKLAVGCWIATLLGLVACSFDWLLIYAAVSQSATVLGARGPRLQLHMLACC